MSWSIIRGRRLVRHWRLLPLATAALSSFFTGVNTAAGAVRAGAGLQQNPNSAAAAWPQHAGPAADTAPAWATAAAPLALRGVTVIDVERGRYLAAQTVVVIGNRIQALGPAAKVKLPRGAQVVDGRGKYLIPGLWDMHVHANGPNDPYLPYLVHGVTGVRDMGTAVPLDTLHRWRRETAAGKRISPRFVAAGPYFEGVDSFGYGVTPAPRTPEAARRAVDSLHAAGADFIKIHFNAQVPRAVVFAIFAEARRVGIPVVGHPPNSDSMSLAEASDSGQRTFEHMHFLRTPCRLTDSLSERQCAEEVAHLVRNRTWITPTTIPYDGIDTLRSGWLSTYAPDSAAEIDATRGAALYTLWLVHKLHRMGVRLLAATDAQSGRTLPPGSAALVTDAEILGARGQIHNELAALVAAGLTPLEALQTATLNPAQYLGATDSLGTIARHKVADLVLLDADPLADIHNTAKICAVVTDGRYFDRAALDRLAAQVVRRIRGQ